MVIMGLRYFIVDVFAQRKYTGNQLAVVLDAEDLSDDDMQAIAREMHFSETAFIRSKAHDSSCDVRIFTPEHEVPFAGHPTLGTAYIIQKEMIREPINEIGIDLAVGRIPVSFTYKNGDPHFLWMRQNPPVFTRTFSPTLIADVLSISEESIDSRFPIQEVSTGLPFIIVPIRTREALRTARINRDLYLDLIRTTRAKALFLFCPEPYHAEHTFNARLFADYYGITEDPATGSANGCLAGYLIHNRYFGDNSIDITVEQGYEINRPSLICCKAKDWGDGIEVHVGGNVIMVAQGQFL